MFTKAMMNISSPVIILISLVSFSIIPTNSGIKEIPEEVDSWFKKLALNHSILPEKMTKLHFYFHDLLQGKNATSTWLVKRNNITDSSSTFFGALIEADDPLTVAPELSSKRVGYARGLYGGASKEEVGLVQAMIFVFTEGVLNGSSLSVLGYNPGATQVYREIPVVGGTGVFRLARGVSTWKTYFFDVVAGNSTVEINVTVLHY